MKNTRKIFVALLVVFTLLMSFATITASAAKTTVDTVIYLSPNSNWKTDNARFAVYIWNDNGNKWFDMTDSDGDGIYECVIPAGYEEIIFCRMNPSTTSNNWDEGVKWNQTENLKYDGTNNLYTVKSGTWDKGGGTWSFMETGSCIHTPSGEGEVITPATCTTDGEISHICSKCGEPYTATIVAPGHKYSGAEAICSCNAQATFTVAGDNTALFGTEWDPSNTDNALTYNEVTGLWTISYVNESNATIWPNFKVCLDKGWNKSWGAAAAGQTNADNAWVEVPAGYTLTISFDYEDEKLAFETKAPCAHEYFYPCDAHCMICFELTNPDASHNVAHADAVEATCQAMGNVEYWYCSDCGTCWADEALTQQTNRMSIVTVGDHNYSEGTCSVCGAEDPDYVAPEIPATNDKLINFSTWEEFAKETYADGDTVKYNDIFTFIYSSNSRVDGSDKTWDDFTGTLRFSFGGKTPTGSVPSKNALQITVDGAYTLKIWYVAGGDGRYFALMDSNGAVLTETTKETVKNTQYYAEIEIPAAGVYYLGVPADNNYIFQIELVEKASGETPSTCEHSYFYSCDKVCEKCGEITNPDADHTIVHVDAVAATCYENGNIEYWYCSDCGYAWADEALTQQTNQMSIVTPNKDHEYLNSCDAHCMNCGELTNEDAAHTVEHVEAVAPTCTAMGNVEYWYCTICGSAWTDEAQTQVTNQLSVKLNMADHNYVDGKCECGAEDPNYVPPVDDPIETPDDPTDDPTDPDEPIEGPGFFEKIWQAILDFFKSIGQYFSNLFGGSEE